ncbi:MAG: ABC transporter substrate-binding protein [Syntrophales bacterium]|jgi:branched-chain amino acid transport system substrate-binding protein|nr:ABC transporter substrate-binding protein [Syntrophales bacterium]MDY0043776.1 ABC transporter substrate-binding protein [Syntrophales bacterium]
MQIRVSIFICAIIILIQCTAASCAETDKVRIGICLPVTGSLSAYGQKLHAGIFAAHAIQPVTTSRIPIELVVVDTKGNAHETLEALKKLTVQHNVSAIILETDKDALDAGSEITEKKEIPVVTTAVTASDFRTSKKFLFRLCFSDTYQTELIARYAIETLEARKASILIDIEKNASTCVADFFKKKYGSMGGKVVSIAYCTSQDKDLAFQISSLMAAKPNILFLPVSYPEAFHAVSKAGELGFSIPMFTITEPDPGMFIEAGGARAEGLMFFGQFNLDAPKEKESNFATRFKAERGYEPGVLETLGADAYFILVDAIQRAQSTRGREIRNSLACTKAFPGLSGPLALGEDGNLRKNAFLFQIKEGRITFLRAVAP